MRDVDSHDRCLPTQGRKQKSLQHNDLSRFRAWHITRLYTSRPESDYGYLSSVSFFMKHLVLAALALSMMTATASAQQAPAPANRPAPGQPPASGPGVIRGKLVDAESGAGIGAASVSVRNAAGVLVAGAIASQDGSFAIEGLRPGKYTLRYTMIGYAIEN